MALLEVGRVIRPHGLLGEVVVALVTNRLERLAPGSTLSGAAKGKGPQGATRRLEVVSSRPQKDRFLVRFADVGDRDGAESLRDLVLYAEALSEPGALFVHELIGCELLDQTGKSHGVVRSVEANPASDLLVVDDGYVPMRFVTSVVNDQVFVEVPEGLFG